MNARSHFWCPKITSYHFNTTIFIFVNLFYKMATPAAFLDVRNSLSIVFLAISDRYATSFFKIFDLMAAVGNFGCPKFTFSRISGHFKLIPNFHKMAAIVHFGFRNSLSIAFLAILDKYRIIYFWNFFQNGRRRPLWMWEISIAFLAISDHMQLFFKFWHNGCRRPFWMSKIHFRSHFWPFQIDKQLYFV